MTSFEEGMIAFNKKDYHTAIRLFLQATKEDEKNHRAWNALGVTLVKTHQYEDADICFKVAIDLAPGNGIYIKNQLANRSKITVKRSITQIIRLEVDHLIHIIKTKKTGPIIGLLLGICIICFLLAATLPLIITGLQPYVSQISIIAGLITGLAFIFLLYGEQITKSLSTLPGFLLFVTLIGGLIIICYIILNPSVLPLGDTHNNSEVNNSSTGNFSRGPVIQYSPEKPVGAVPTQSKAPASSPGECMPPNPALVYTINDYDPFTVTFSDKSPSVTPLIRRFWTFGDHQNSTEARPTHLYAGSPAPYTIQYIIENQCGSSNTTLFIDPQCNEILPGFSSSKKPGDDTQTIQFNDNSSPVSDITSWRWVFGDGESYYTTNPAKKDCTHRYQQKGIYQVSLVVQNRCRQEFSITKQISVEHVSVLSGTIWEDTNLNGVLDLSEHGLINWEVFLEENMQDGWKIRQTTQTNQTGTYVFTVSDTGGTYRIRESAPDQSWRVTNPSNPNLMNVSSPFSLTSGESFPQANFGNIKLKGDKLHTISLQTNRNGTITGGGYISWIDVGSGTLKNGNNQYTLPDNRQCVISLPENITNAHLEINGNIQKYSGLNGTLQSGEVTVPLQGNTSLSIPTSMNYISNLHLRLNAGKSSYVNFIVDGTVIPVNWRGNIDLFDLMPSPGPHMLLTMSDNETVFIGQASDYTIS